MALRIAPPQHSIDDPPEWIPNHDPAWDHERIKRERKLLGDRESEHPVVVYYDGKTRFSLTAPITVPEEIRGEDGPASAPVTKWLTSEPTIFTLKVLGGLGWELAMNNPDRMYWEFSRRGVLAVRNIDVQLELDADGLTSSSWLDMLSRSHRDIVNKLGYAIFTLNIRPEASAEGKP